MAGIYTKLADVMQDVGSVGKNGYNQQQGFAFRSSGGWRRPAWHGGRRRQRSPA